MWQEEGQNIEWWLKELEKEGAYNHQCRSTFAINSGGISHLYIRTPSQEKRMISKLLEQVDINCVANTASEYHPRKGKHVPFRDANGEYTVQG